MPLEDHGSPISVVWQQTECFMLWFCLVTPQLRSIKHSFGSKFVLQCKEAVLVSAPSIIMQWNSRREEREGGRGGSPACRPRRWRGFSMGNFQMKGIDRRKAAAAATALCGIVVREREGGEFWVKCGFRSSCTTLVSSRLVFGQKIYHRV